MGGIGSTKVGARVDHSRIAGRPFGSYDEPVGAPPGTAVDTGAIRPPLTRWSNVWRYALALALSVGVAADSYPEFWDDSRWRIPIDLALGATAFVLAAFRRARPLAIALATLVLATFATLAAGPALLATVSVATRRRTREMVVVGIANVVSCVVYYLITPSRSAEPTWVSLLLSIVFVSSAIGWGMYIGSRRELLFTLRQRAVRAEAERDLRVGMAQADERARIAREMHDVLAHRISQVSMHAGALAFRTDLDAEALRAGAAEIQTRANDALTDLRSVLGVLRDSHTGSLTNRPQPTFEDLPALVTEARAAGARVEFSDRLAVDDRPPTALGRTLYRLVQEGITNAHKHAPGAVLDVTLSGDRERGIELVLRNPLGLGPPAAPGAGLGLVGLVERVEFAGGTLRHGVEHDAFVVRASLPWLA